MRAAATLATALVLCAGCSDDAAPPVVVDAAAVEGGAADSAAPVTGKLGSPCQQDDQCDHKLCLLKRGAGTYPGGYCSLGCDAISAPCPAGAHCVGTTNGNCFGTCTAAGECRAGYLCKDPPGGGPPKICFPQ